MTSNYDSRSSSIRFIVGKVEDHIPDSVLPTNRDILKYLLYRKQEKLKTSKKSPPLMPILSCKLSPKLEALCSREDGCLSTEDRCIVGSLKEIWRKAGISTMADNSIQNKLIKLNDAYNNILKHRSKTSPKAEKDRQDFDKYLDTLFDIAHKDAETSISNDRLRSDKAKSEDLTFLQDQRSDRKMTMSNKDLQYSKKVSEKIERESRKRELAQALEKSKLPEDKTGEKNDSDREADHNSSDENNNDSSFESVEPPSKKRKSDFIQLSVPRDIFKDTGVVNARCKVSSRSQVLASASLIVNSSGNLKDFKISQSTAIRRRKAEVSSTAASFKEDFKEKVRNSDGGFILHFDTKAVEDVTGGKKATRERLAVLLTSPDISEGRISSKPIPFSFYFFEV